MSDQPGSTPAGAARAGSSTDPWAQPASLTGESARPILGAAGGWPHRYLGGCRTRGAGPVGPRAALTRSTAFWIGTALLGMVIVFGVISPDNAFLRPSNLLISSA